MNTSNIPYVHYGKEYNEKVLAPIELGEKIQATLFSEYINPNDLVLDFGCGRGGILQEIICAEKHGIEINKYAVKEASKKSDKVFSDFDSIKDNYYDKIISNHALEHASMPLDILKKLNKKLKDSGEIIFVLPLDDWRSKIQRDYNAEDINQHLYAWTPQSIGNLFKSAEFSNILIKIITKAWSPKILWMRKVPFAFNFTKYLLAVLKKRRQLLIRATK